ncbi:MAG: hypothetical protein WBN92_11520, partial [Terriglobia bacterium]
RIMSEAKIQITKSKIQIKFKTQIPNKTQTPMNQTEANKNPYNLKTHPKQSDIISWNFTIGI